MAGSIDSSAISRGVTRSPRPVNCSVNASQAMGRTHTPMYLAPPQNSLAAIVDAWSSRA